jgi:hypothetical protein
MMDWGHIAELAVMGLLSFAGSWGAIRARLTAVEKSADHAHKRIDSLLMRKHS